jgi:hypothetical protein
MVVSGLLYNAAESEPWLQETFAQMLEEESHGCEPLVGLCKQTSEEGKPQDAECRHFEESLDGRLSWACKDTKWPKVDVKGMPSYPRVDGRVPFCSGTLWCSRLLRGGAQVFHSSRTGSLAAWLPDAELHETYPEYLQRLDTNTSLLAEAVMASHSTLEHMRFGYDFAESKPCSVNTCFNEFYENCTSTWGRVLSAWEIPSPERSAMLQSVVQSCPEVSNGAVEHSSSEMMKDKGLKHLPSYELVERLKDIDRQLLDGSLAALEEHLNCHVSGKYRKPALDSNSY